MQDLWAASWSAVRRFHDDEDGVTTLEMVLIGIVAVVAIIGLYNIMAMLMPELDKKIKQILGLKPYTPTPGT